MHEGEGAIPHGLLAQFGVSDDAESLWRALLAAPNAELAELRGGAGVSAPEADAAIEALIKVGLVRASSAPAGITATDPALAVELQIAKAERDIAERARSFAELRVMIPELSALYSHGRTLAHQGPDFEIIFGLEEINRRCLLYGARTMLETRAIAHSTLRSGMQNSRSVDSDALTRGVRELSIVPAIDLEDPGLYADLEDRAREGEIVRVLPTTPTRMLIFDRTLAVLPVDPTDIEIGAMFFRAASVIDPLILLFDHLWSEAAPVFTAAMNGATPSARASHVLELLATGTKDERIARSLGVGVRTVRRDIADLKTTLGVSSRTEIVAAAMRKGWL